MTLTVTVTGLGGELLLAMEVDSRTRICDIMRSVREVLGKPKVCLLLREDSLLPPEATVAELGVTDDDDVALTAILRTIASLRDEGRAVRSSGTSATLRESSG